MHIENFLDAAGRWFLRSGIQEPNGGVARYYRTDTQRNNPLSTEITGYAISTFVHLYETTGKDAYLDAAIDAGRFLCRAWNGPLDAMPYEYPHADFSYFFDCGIIIRGLLTLHRIAPADEYLETAVLVAQSMARDFEAARGEYHPILILPEKTAVPRDDRWSRSTACYQLKSAMGWHDLFEVTREREFEDYYRDVLDFSLHSYDLFLPGHAVREKVMDRLHAFSYFLEALLPCAGEAICVAALADGIQRAARHLRDIAPEFARSDVYAQLLRVRVFADWAGAVPMDREAACEEARQLRQFQTPDADPRIDGGFWFGRKPSGFLPYVNPVSTGFALQALDCWDRWQNGDAPVDRRSLI